ncbi:choline ethanolaminephosphotransferase [Armillaria nabsnona]|nr:choline ethanolaminephosphotransferase [Armillaria nabsnona]
MGYLPQQSLENLKKYSYKGVDKSLVSRYVLNPFWNWFVTLWPMTVAPNTITLSGLCIVFMNFLTMIYYDPAYLTEKGGATPLPSWIYFTWGIGLFLYQSFDAIDGKQARRTGMAGPLGEMFDHGCDALNTTLEVIICAQAMNLGRSWWTVASQVATLANFYLTTWEEYHTGQLYLGVFSGPVEGILMIVTIYIITGFFGPSFWDQGILTFLHLEHLPLFSKIPNVGLNETFMVFAAFGLAFNIVSSYLNVRRAMKATGKSTLRPLLFLLPYPIAAAIQIAWLSYPAYYSSAIINSSLFVPFLCAWGLQFAHQVGRMILAHVTSTPFPVWDWMWIWSIIGAIDANLPRLFGRPPIIQYSHGSTAWFVYGTLAISLFTYGRFCTLVINDITNYMGIACFTVRKRDAAGIWRDATKEKKV